MLKDTLFSFNKLIRISCLLLMLLVIVIIIARKNVRGVESNVIYTVERVLESNKNLYTNIKEAPYSVTQYSPLYYMVSDGLMSIVNLNTTGNYYWFRVLLRLQNVFFILVILYVSLKLIELNRGAELTTNEKIVFTLLSVGCTAPWLFIVRPDILVTLFFVLGAYFLLKGLKEKNNRLIFYSGMVSLLAFLSKQNGLLMLFVSGSFLLFERQIKLGLLYVLGAITAGFFFSIAYYLLGYPINYFYENLVIGVDNGVDLYKAIQKAIIPFILIFGFPTLYIFSRIEHNFSYIKSKQSLSFLLYFSTSALLFALITCLKIGSSENYFVDFIWLVLIFIFSLEFISISKKKMVVCFLFSLSVLSYQLLNYFPRSVFFTFGNKHKNELAYANSIIEKYGEEKYIYTNIRNIILNRPNQCIFPQYEIFNQSVKQKKGNKLYASIIDNIDYQKVGLLVIDTNMDYLSLDLNQFELVDTKDNIHVYKKISLK